MGHHHSTALCSPPPPEAVGNWHRGISFGSTHQCAALSGQVLGSDDINLQNPLNSPWAPSVLFRQNASPRALYSFSIFHLEEEFPYPEPADTPPAPPFPILLPTPIKLLFKNGKKILWQTIFPPPSLISV